MDIQTQIEVVKNAVTMIWINVSAIMIFQMQVGFTLLECGSIRKKNYKSILLKNILDTCICTFVFWMIGYSMAFG